MANIYGKIATPGFEQFSGYWPEEGLRQTLEDYGRYVIKEGRKIPKDLWVGTAMAETTAGKFGFPGNPMMAHPPDDFYNRRLQEWGTNNPGWLPKTGISLDAISSLAEAHYKEGAGSKYDVVNGQVITRPYKNYGEAVQDEVARMKEMAMNKDSRYNLTTDWAAEKLQKGLDKYGSSAKAARFYNPYDKKRRENIPRMGREILNNPAVRKLMGDMIGE